MCGAARIGGGSFEIQTCAESTDFGDRGCRGCAAGYGICSVARYEEAAWKDESEHFADGRNRTERSLRGAGTGGDAGPGIARRRRTRESEWRRDRDWPSAGSERRAAGDHRHVPTACYKRALRTVHHVHRRGPRNCNDH